MLPRTGNPQVDIFFEADSVCRLDRIRRAEYGSDHRYDVHERHADDTDHVPPAQLEGLDDRRSWNVALFILFGKGWGLVDFTADDIAGDDDKEAEQEWYAPTPAIERLGRHVSCQRQENRRCKNLPSLHTLQRKARIKSASAEWSMLQDH
jgi:hypothetical protein